MNELANKQAANNNHHHCPILMIEKLKSFEMKIGRVLKVVAKSLHALGNDERKNVFLNEFMFILKYM
jgi:hypothetical protein